MSNAIQDSRERMEACQAFSWPVSSAEGHTKSVWWINLRVILFLWLWNMSGNVIQNKEMVRTWTGHKKHCKKSHASKKDAESVDNEVDPPIQDLSKNKKSSKMIYKVEQKGKRLAHMMMHKNHKV